MNMIRPQHGDGEACYFCATDTELMAALRGWPLTPFHMHAPRSFCPDPFIDGDMT